MSNTTILPAYHPVRDFAKATGVLWVTERSEGCLREE